MFNHKVVDCRSKHIHKQDSQHHALGEAGGHHTDNDSHSTDDKAIDPFDTFRTSRGNRVSSHKHGTKAEASHHKMLPPFNSRHVQTLEKESRQ